MPFETPDLLPASVAVPTGFETERFRVRPLTLDDAAIDYEAVTTSRERIGDTFGPDHEWPPADLTLEQNRVDVAWHQKEHQRRDAFTYAVLTPDESVELGCLYVQPTVVPDVEAAVYYWTATASVERGLAASIATELRAWLAESWPLDSLAYPGRDESWAAWASAKSDAEK